MSSRKSNKQFKKDTFNITRDEYKVLGKYIGANKKLNLKHNTCAHEFETKESHFFNTCSIFPIYSIRNRCHDNYIELVKSFIGCEYTVIVKYRTYAVPVLTIHNIYDFKYAVRAINFTKITNFTSCHAYKGTLRYTTYSFKEESYTVHREEYIVLDEFNRIDEKILIKHNRCRKEYKVQAGSFLKLIISKKSMIFY